MFEDSRRDMSQNLHQTQPVMESSHIYERLLFYLCNYCENGNPSIVEGTAFLLIEIF